MKVDLTSEELDVLIEAMKSWEKEPSSDATMRGMFDSLFTVMDPNFDKLTQEQKEERIHQRQRRREDQIAAMTELRRETSILLQAKLIQARQKG